MSKKILSIVVLVLTLSFSTNALASLTFTTDAITGTTASTIDLGTGNTLSLNTISNAPITTGTGLVTLGGALNITGDVGIGTTTPQEALEVNGNIMSLNFKTNDYNQAIAIGFWESDQFLDLGHANTTIGFYTMGTSTSSRITYDAEYNSSFGYKSMSKMTTGDYNSAFGSEAMSENTTGTRNTAFGAESLFMNSTGSNNTAIGYQADVANGVSNATVIGNNAYATASNQVVIGNDSVAEVQMGTGGVAKIKATTAKFTTIPTYANNAAALAGGLVAGDLYYTDTAGEYIVKVTHNPTP